MKRNVLIGIVFVFSLITLSVYSSPTDDILEKEYQESFQVNENATLNVHNKYGDIFLTTWDKNEIKIDVIVTVEFENNRSKITRFFEDIEVEITGDENKVEAITRIPSTGWTGNIQVNIDYHISSPSSVMLDIKQRYGNVILNNDWLGETDFDISYGSLQARKLSNHNNKIDVSYGDFIAHEIVNCNIDLSYSEFSVKKAKSMELDASYSEVDLGVVDGLDLKADFVEIEIKEVGDLYARADYSEIEIDNLINSLEADLDYGDFRIDNVEPKFKLIEIDSDNAGVEIEIDNSASYSIEVYTRYGDLYLRDSHGITKEKLSSHSYKYTGDIGSSSDRGKVIIDSNYASIEIK